MVGGFIIPIEPICGGCSVLHRDDRSYFSNGGFQSFFFTNLKPLCTDCSYTLLDEHIQYICHYTDHAISHHACRCGGREGHD